MIPCSRPACAHGHSIIRRIARLLWTLLLDFEDGFEASVLAQFPKALMSELALYTHKSLLDLANAFPNATVIEIVSRSVDDTGSGPLPHPVRVRSVGPSDARRAPDVWRRVCARRTT